MVYTKGLRIVYFGRVVWRSGWFDKEYVGYMLEQLDLKGGRGRTGELSSSLFRPRAIYLCSLF